MLLLPNSTHEKKKRNNTKTLLSGSKLCLIHVVLIQTKSRTVLRYIHETALKCRSKRIVQYSVSPPICGGLSESRSVTWNVMLPQQGCLGGTVPCEEKEAVWPKHRQGVCDMKNTRSTTMFSMPVTGCGGWGVKCLQSVIKFELTPCVVLTNHISNWLLTVSTGVLHCTIIWGFSTAELSQTMPSRFAFPYSVLLHPPPRRLQRCSAIVDNAQQAPIYPSNKCELHLQDCAERFLQCLCVLLLSFCSFKPNLCGLKSSFSPASLFFIYFILLFHRVRFQLFQELC